MENPEITRDGNEYSVAGQNILKPVFIHVKLLQF